MPKKKKMKRQEMMEAPVETPVVEEQVEIEVGAMPAEEPKQEPEAEIKEQEEVQENLENVDGEQPIEMPENKLQLYFVLFEYYALMLGIHLHSKTRDHALHKETEERYELLFDILHGIGEKYVDLGGEVFEGYTENDLREKALNILIEVNELLNKCADRGQNWTRGVDAMVSEYINKLEFEIGNAKSLVKEHYKEREDM